MFQGKKDKELRERIDEANKLKDFQGSEGVIQNNPYMIGLYNGMELALSVVEDRKPKLINMFSGEEIVQGDSEEGLDDCESDNVELSRTISGYVKG